MVNRKRRRMIGRKGKDRKIGREKKFRIPPLRSADGGIAEYAL